MSAPSALRNSAARKRGREQDEEVEVLLSVSDSRGPVFRPSEATPCRRSTEAAAVDLALPAGLYRGCWAALDEDSTHSDGLSEDSIFHLDISVHSRPDADSAASSPPRVLTAAANETDAAEWQRQLGNFFARLDQRPLSVVQHPSP